MKLGHAIANFFSGFWNNDLKPWVIDLFHHVQHDVVDAVVPLAHEAAQEILSEGGKLLDGSASLQSIAANAGSVLMRTAMKMEKAAIQVGGHDLLTAVAAVLANRNAADGSAPIPSNVTNPEPVSHGAPS